MDIKARDVDDHLRHSVLREEMQKAMEQEQITALQGKTTNQRVLTTKKTMQEWIDMRILASVRMSQIQKTSWMQVWSPVHLYAHCRVGG